MQEKIVHFLKQAEGYVSGEEMSEQLSISRAAVWKYIDQLRHDGYSIAAVPHLGYKLESSPDKLLPAEISFGLKTKFMGKDIIALDTVDSTMDEAFRLGMEGAVEGTVVCAESQTKGRGRLGRRWISPRGKGMYFSIILRPPFAPAQMAQLTLMTAVALAEALEAVADVKAQIKWPNDVLLSNKKVAGILTELRAEVDQVKFVVIGIGLNINTAPAQLIPEATSLKIETGETYNRVRVLQAILTSLERWYIRLKKDEFPQVLTAWKRQCITLKKRVRIADATGVTEGIAVDVNQDGGLLIRKDSGQTIKKMAGDAVIVRS